MLNPGILLGVQFLPSPPIGPMPLEQISPTRGIANDTRFTGASD